MKFTYQSEKMINKTMPSSSILFFLLALGMMQGNSKNNAASAFVNSPSLLKKMTSSSARFDPCLSASVEKSSTSSQSKEAVCHNDSWIQNQFDSMSEVNGISPDGPVVGPTNVLIYDTTLRGKFYAINDFHIILAKNKELHSSSSA